MDGQVEEKFKIIILLDDRYGLIKVQPNKDCENWVEPASSEVLILTEEVEGWKWE